MQTLQKYWLFFLNDIFKSPEKIGKIWVEPQKALQIVKELLSKKKSQ